MKRTMRAAIGMAIAVGLVGAVALEALAEDLSIKAFSGTWSGSGLARNDESDYFGLTIRDLDVTIQPAGEGFVLGWTTVLREGGDPNNPDVKRKSESITFVPSGRPGIYVPEGGAGDPVASGRSMWAFIEGQTLTVNVVSVLEDGEFQLQRYDRALTDLGMELEFMRVSGHGVARAVSGRLTKRSN